MTGSCCRRATRRRCCGRCCTSRMCTPSIPTTRCSADRAVTLDDLKSFRQLGLALSRDIPSTGGQAASRRPPDHSARAWRHRLAWRSRAEWLAAHYNRDGFHLFDFDVYALAGDGCMMEGVSVRGRLAGRPLGTVDTVLDLRLEPGHHRRPHRHHVHRGRRGAVPRLRLEHDDRRRRERPRGQVSRALHTFSAEHERPTLMVMHSHIGYGSPVEDSPKAHGAPLGPEAVRATKRMLGIPGGRGFHVPDAVYDTSPAGIGTRGGRLRRQWERCSASTAAYPRRSPTRSSGCSAGSFRRAGWPVSRSSPDEKGLATRDSSAGAQCRRQGGAMGPRRVRGPGAVDQDEARVRGAEDFQAETAWAATCISAYREHTAAAVANGMALTKLRPYWSGFLIFSDYARGAIRCRR